jgi:DDE superfamily endonuclease
LLLRITAPKSREAKNGTSYYSGHYRDFGINVQAICDSNCRFIFAALAAPGGTNDIAAYRKTSIMEKIENLPIGKYVIGDNAYVCTEHLLTPFSGDDKKDPMKDAYNFHLSQVRIRIEMTFGQFINKWRYFGRSSQLSIKNHGMLFMCATRLHNFCINERLLNSSTLANGRLQVPIPDGPNEPLLVPPYGEEEEIAEENVNEVHHNSMMRQILLEKVISKNLVRPAYNLKRNRSDVD